MKRLALGALLLLAAAPAALAQGWDLVWSDEFDGTSVNSSNWTFEVGGGGWGNNELQYYTSGSNATVSGGVLTITARRVTGGFTCWYGTCQYTSTRMITRGKREFTYGRIEARLALPMGQGLWPAFWGLGTNIGSVGWPACGEIDVMEHVNRRNAHPRDDPLGCRGTRQLRWLDLRADPTAFHVYAIEWTPAAIKWFVDGVQFREANIQNSINSTEEFHRPFFVLLNLAVGGNWPGSPDARHGLPGHAARRLRAGLPGEHRRHRRDLAYRLVHGAEPEQHDVRGPGRPVERQRRPGSSSGPVTPVSTSSGSSAPPTTATTTSSLARPRP